MQIRNITIVGAGIMGSGIAQVAAYSGFDVTLVDISAARVDGAITAITRRLQREAERARERPGLSPLLNRSWLAYFGRPTRISPFSISTG